MTPDPQLGVTQRQRGLGRTGSGGAVTQVDRWLRGALSPVQGSVCVDEWEGLYWGGSEPKETPRVTFRATRQ